MVDGSSPQSVLTWIASWLACLLGIINILITIASGTETLSFFSHEILVYVIIYVGLVSGMLLSVYRLSNITSEIIIWASKITSARVFCVYFILLDITLLLRVLV